MAWDFNNISHGTSPSSNEDNPGKAVAEDKTRPKQLVFTTIPSLQIESSPSVGLPQAPNNDIDSNGSGERNLDMYDGVGEDARDDQVKHLVYCLPMLWLCALNYV
jgi:hypothetical protein